VLNGNGRNDATAIATGGVSGIALDIGFAHLISLVAFGTADGPTRGRFENIRAGSQENQWPWGSEQV